MKPKTQRSPAEFRANTSTVVVIAPIVPEKAEAWRRLMQELADSRHGEHEASRQRLGIRAEQAWIRETRHWTIGMIVIETANAQQTLAALATSKHAFDCWFREQLQALQGVDLTRSPPAFLPELVFAWGDSRRKGGE